MLIGLLALVVFAQWAVYAARRGDKAHAALALGLVGLLGLAVINAQAYVWNQIEMPIVDGGYPGMFYAVTGTMTALLIAGVVYTARHRLPLPRRTRHRPRGRRRPRPLLVRAHRRVLRGLVRGVRDEVIGTR